MFELNKISFLLFLIFNTLFTFDGDAKSAGGETYDLIKPGFSFEGATGTFDRAQLRRGYQVYKEVCASCHSMKQLSFRNLSQKGGPEYTESDAKIFASEFFITDSFDDYGDPIERARVLSDSFPDPYESKEAAKASNNGAYPPDLSLIVKARSGGYNYIYSLLQGYGKEIPEGVEISDTLSYNPWFPGGGIAMYQPLYDESVEYEDGTYASIEQMSADVTAFLAWSAEPEMEERKRLGFIVMSFLFIFALLMFFTTNRLWRDVH